MPSGFNINKIDDTFMKKTVIKIVLVCSSNCKITIIPFKFLTSTGY